MGLDRILFACLVGALVVGRAANAQGNHAEVTDDDVVALQLNHYFTADKASHAPDFEWTFTKDGFAMNGGTGKIPAYLLETLLPKGETAREITGKWKLKDGRLVLSAIKADGKDVEREASLRIYRTAPTVVRVGDVQHVFEVRR